jgi:hypothetical protein|tara:strand:- start:1465 stop:1806 length:342 start_codon:yes stop_codon:yes gene_type:complete
MKFLIKKLWQLLLGLSGHTSYRRFASVKTNVQFTYSKIGASVDEDALALVRFTSYDDSSRALAVEQVTYKDGPTGYRDFESQVAAALDCGIDVDVMSPYDLDYFPLLESIVTR